jgi:5'(3')-deoxyribonucleotidase
MKPVLALDGDGVLIDFGSPVLDYMQSRGINKTYEQITNWDIFDNDKQLEEDYKREVVSHPNFCRNLKPLSGAIEFVRAASEAYHIMIVTAPYNVPNWYDGRENWVVEKLGLPRKCVCFLTEKEFFDSDIFIDDKDTNILEWQKRHPEKLAIIKDQPWNRTATFPNNVKRAITWYDVSSYLEEQGFPAIRGNF